MMNNVLLDNTCILSIFAYVLLAYSWIQILGSIVVEQYSSNNPVLGIHWYI